MQDWDAEMSQMILRRRLKRRDEADTPWKEVKKWKRRFWWLAVYAVLTTMLAWWLVNTSGKPIP
jgi:hypothetical protein